MDHIVFIKELKEWIDQQMEHSQSLNIHIIALRSGYSKWHLQRIFHDVTGEYLGVYLRDRKLLLASIALCSSRRPIIDISTQYGYGTQQSFTRAFKSKFQCTPGQYRRSAVAGRREG